MPRYLWVSVLGEPLVPYVTFDYIEVGTVRCGGPTPPSGSLREKAIVLTGC